MVSKTEEIKQMSLTGEAIRYLQLKFPDAIFLRDIVLRDDGNGPYIYYWGLGSPQPTEQELNQAAASMLPPPVYPTIEEQLLMIYNDKKNNTNTFVEAVDKYKSDRAIFDQAISGR